MISWLQRRSPDVWHVVAGHLNWDFAIDVLEWIVSQPQCDLATAALLFWTGDPEQWLKYQTKDTIPDFAIEYFNISALIVNRAKSGLYNRQELAFAGDPCNMIGGVDYHLKFSVEKAQRRFKEKCSGSFPWELPIVLTPPIPGRAPLMSSEEDPEQGAEIQALLAALGTYVSTEPTPPRPQKFQIGERVTNIWYQANKIYNGTGTILNVNDGVSKVLYLVLLDNGTEVVLTDNLMEKVT